MKVLNVMLMIAALAGCSRADSGAAQTPSATPQTSESATSGAKVITASATGTVESVDVSAKKITIAHGPIAAIHWPAMTMTFDAPAADLSSIKAGDKVDFDLAVDGMHGEVARITRQ